MKTDIEKVRELYKKETGKERICAEGLPFVTSNYSDWLESKCGSFIDSLQKSEPEDVCEWVCTKSKNGNYYDDIDVSCKLGIPCYARENNDECPFCGRKIKRINGE